MCPLPPRVSSASNHLHQQQTLVKTSRSPNVSSSSKVSQLHLPSLPTRHGIKHLSVTRANRDNVPRQLPASGRGGGTGRREAVTAASRASTGANAHITRQSARTHGRSSITASRESVAPHVTVSKVSPRYYDSSHVSRWKTCSVKLLSFLYLPAVQANSCGSSPRHSVWWSHAVQSTNSAAAQPPDVHSGQTLDPSETRHPTYSSPHRFILFAVWVWVLCRRRRNRAWIRRSGAATSDPGAEPHDTRQDRLQLPPPESHRHPAGGSDRHDSWETRDVMRWPAVFSWRPVWTGPGCRFPLRQVSCGIHRRWTRLSRYNTDSDKHLMMQNICKRGSMSHN